MTGPSAADRRRRSYRLAAVGLLSSGLASLVVALLLVTPMPGLAPGGADRSAEPARPDPHVGEATGWEPVADPWSGVPHTTAGEPTTAPAEGTAALPVEVAIPAVGIRSDLVGLDIDDDRRLGVPSDAAQAGWYVRSPRPGEEGAAVIAGHVDSRRGPGVFWRLRELVPEDRIVVRREDGSEVGFVVDRVEQWPKDRFPTDAVYREADGSELRVITCAGDFDPTTRSYVDNLIVFAKLVS
jgi:sortase (surface protein transpeptidase)